MTAGLVPPQKETSLFPLTEVPAIVASLLMTNFLDRCFHFIASAHVVRGYFFLFYGR
jgi:hypothetical protein